MRRLITFWSASVVLLVLLAVGAVTVVNERQRQVSLRAEQAVVETARIVTALVVHPHVTVTELSGSALAAAKRQNMDAAISEVLRREQLVGLRVWSLRGHLLYSAGSHSVAEQTMPARELERSGRGEPWVTRTAASAERHVRTLKVFLPYDPDRDGSHDGTIEVLIPQDPLTDRINRTTLKIYSMTAALFMSLVGVLFALRRRLLAREYQALHDPLTGLPNRVALRRQAESVIADVQARPGKQAALLLLDLDGFKLVNDTLGHPSGDELLVQVAQSLRASVRASDLVARLGGDEFAILLSQLPGDGSAEVIARKLLERLRTTSYQVNGIDLNVDASIGISLLPEHGSDMALLLRRADVAMYLAKRANAGVAVYDETRDPYDVSQLGLLVELRSAIEQDELRLHFQPKLHLRTGDLQGIEALVRWQHPTRGLLQPLDFIPLAENTGLMQPLTEWVLSHAIAQAAQFRDDGLMISVAVNIGPRTVLDRNLPSTLLRLLADGSLPAHLLELEITETAIMTDPLRAAEVLGHLQVMGVRVAIDDFGAGYSSLGYMRSLPINTLKIDQCFISEMLHSIRDEAIVESVIGLGHKLGFTVVAEGIESPAVLQRLKDLHCDEGQGFHIARPMPPEQLRAWITGHLRGPAAAQDGSSHKPLTVGP